MFALECGHLQVRKVGSKGSDVTLRVMGSGEVGGLTSMTTSKRRSATLLALDACTVVRIDRDRFLELLSAHPELMKSVMAHLSAKVRAKTRELAMLLEVRTTDLRMPVAFFDTKPYDRASFEKQLATRTSAEGRPLSDLLSLHFFDTRLGPPGTARLAAGFPVVCAFVNDDLGAATIERLAAGGVQMLAMRCAGYNNVDVGAASSHQISVARVPAYSPHAVAEHAVALILTLNRKTHRAYERVRDGNFSLKGLVGFDLHGRTAGVVGLGKIGRCLAEILVGFGMEVVAYDAFPDAGYAVKAGIRYVDLDTLCGTSDVISLHAPLAPDTYHLVNAERIARMKPGVMLINTSRGGLLDTSALIEGLKTGHVGAAGLDVYEEESEYFFEDRSDRGITDDVLARLMTFPNVLVTSHQGFLTEEALRNIADTTLSNVMEFVGGKRGPDLTHAVLPDGHG
jgi:D-lactate dehydrogenase